MFEFIKLLKPTPGPAIENPLKPKPARAASSECASGSEKWIKVEYRDLAIDHTRALHSIRMDISAKWPGLDSDVFCRQIDAAPADEVHEKAL